MTDRQNYIHPAVKAKPDLVAWCLRRIASVMNLADDQKETVFYASLAEEIPVTAQIVAWSQTALLLADTGDITSDAISMIARSIDAGSTDVLF